MRHLDRSHNDVPSFLVQDGEFAGGAGVRVQQGGEQPDLGGFHAAAAGAGQHGEADEAGGRVQQGREGGVAGARAAAGAHAAALAQQDQLRSVFQHFEGPEGDGLRAVLDAPQQVRASAGEPEPPVHGEEAAVGEIQLAGALTSWETDPMYRDQGSDPTPRDALWDLTPCGGYPRKAPASSAFDSNAQYVFSDFRLALATLPESLQIVLTDLQTSSGLLTAVSVERGDHILASLPPELAGAAVIVQVTAG